MALSYYHDIFISSILIVANWKIHSSKVCVTVSFSISVLSFFLDERSQDYFLSPCITSTCNGYKWTLQSWQMTKFSTSWSEVKPPHFNTVTLINYNVAKCVSWFHLLEYFLPFWGGSILWCFKQKCVRKKVQQKIMDEKIPFSWW